MPAETKAQKRARQLAAVAKLRGLLKRPGDPARRAAEDAAFAAEERAIEQRHENFLMGIEPPTRGKPRPRFG